VTSVGGGVAVRQAPARFAGGVYQMIHYRLTRVAANGSPHPLSSARSNRDRRLVTALGIKELPIPEQRKQDPQAAIDDAAERPA
jgi:hypothetical protein